MKYQINDKSLYELIGLFSLSNSKNVIPRKLNIPPCVSVKKHFLICDQCDNIKLSDNCDTCQVKTVSNHFLLLNIKEQFESFFSKEENIEKIIACKSDLSKLGYHEDSIIQAIHQVDPNVCTLTINTDGMQVFRKSLVDAWPIFLTVNELPTKNKYSSENIFLPGIWMGQRKLSNYVVLNQMCQAIAQLENGVRCSNHTLIKVFCIYGSFDKPARSTMLNRQSSNAEYGCCFCKLKSKRNGHRVYYDVLSNYEYLSHPLITSRMIKSTETNAPFKGSKGFSPLR